VSHILESNDAPNQGSLDKLARAIVKGRKPDADVGGNSSCDDDDDEAPAAPRKKSKADAGDESEAGDSDDAHTMADRTVQMSALSKAANEPAIYFKAGAEHRVATEVMADIAVPGIQVCNDKYLFILFLRNDHVRVSIKVQKCFFLPSLLSSHARVVLCGSQPENQRSVTITTNVELDAQLLREECKFLHEGDIADLENTVQRGKTKVKLLKPIHLNNPMKVESKHIKGVGYPLIGADHATVLL
jgi:hypothetical protein